MAYSAKALTLDYASCLESVNAPNQIDYLSLGIDPAEFSLSVLKKLPHDKSIFIITFEHDEYRNGKSIKVESRRLLRNLGYQLAVEGLQVFDKSFEDWWVNALVIREDVYAKFRHKNIKFYNLWINQAP